MLIMNMSFLKGALGNSSSFPSFRKFLLLHKINLTILIMGLLIVSSNKSSTKTKENSKAKSAEEQILVHVVPHTHDDAGWNWTFEEYYLGTGGSKASVKKILDNFVDSLYDRTDRTFIYVEMAFFTKWYKEQNDITKSKVKNLLKEGRFEFINGGYVMHDEATTYYQHTIDQMRLGLMFLKDEFNFVPDIAWFIDPFGHSASNAYILAKMGFKKIALVRIDYREKIYRKKNKTLEFFYVPFGQIDENVRIFTHVTYNHYCVPSALDPLILDQTVPMNETEVISRAESLVEDYKEMNSRYLHKNLLLMYGCDFTHNKRDVNFQNLEKIMDHINESNDYNMKLAYSTPSRYFDTIFSQVEEWPYYRDYDFFPYADSEFSTWTGYFTSRPYLKGMVREAGNYLSAITQTLFKIILKNKFDKNAQMKINDKLQERLISNIFLNENELIEINLGKNYYNLNYKNNTNSSKVPENRLEALIEEAIEKLFHLREIHAITQHHDAVAGTAKEYVSENYIKLLDEAVKNSKASVVEIFKFLRSDLDVDMKICMDPTVDYACLENLFNFSPNKKLFVKIKNFGSSENGESKEKSDNSDNKEIFKQFDIGADHQIENHNTKHDLHSKGETEMFCIDELWDRTLNCKVYFKSQNKFFITRKNSSKSIFNFIEENQNQKSNVNLRNRKGLNENAALSINHKNNINFAERAVSSIKKPIQKIYFGKKSNNTAVQNEFLIGDFLKINYLEDKNKLTFELKVSQPAGNNNDNSAKEEKYNFDVYHAYYVSYNGSNSSLRPEGSCPSGAYILSTTEVEPFKFNFNADRSYIEKGEFYTRVVMRFSQSYVILTFENSPKSKKDLTDKKIIRSQNKKLHSTSNNNKANLNNYFQVESIWDPISKDAIPKEYLLIVETDIDNNVNLPNGSQQPEFWTDSNGIKMIRRFKDFREGYDYNITDPVAANFYPVNSMISFRDRKNYNYTEANKKDDYLNIGKADRMVTYLNDRSQSIGVMKAGQIIVIQNRHSYRDDWKGLEEIIHENYSFETYFKLRSFVVFGTDEDLIRRVERSIQDRFYMIGAEVREAKGVLGGLDTRVKSKNLTGIKKEKELRAILEKSILDKKAKGIIHSMHILSANQVLIQLLNNCDKYFSYNCEEKPYAFRNDPTVAYKIIEYDFNGTGPQDLTQKPFTNQEDVNLTIKPMDFKLFLVDFE